MLSGWGSGEAGRGVVGRGDEDRRRLGQQQGEPCALPVVQVAAVSWVVEEGWCELRSMTLICS